MPDSRLTPGRVGLARTSSMDASGRVFFGLSRVFSGWVGLFWVGSGFESKIMAHTQPVDCCGSKNTARARSLRCSGRIGLGFFGRVGSGWSGDPYPDLVPRSSLANISKEIVNFFELLLIP